MLFMCRNDLVTSMHAPRKDIFWALDHWNIPWNVPRTFAENSGLLIWPQIFWSWLLSSHALQERYQTKAGSSHGFGLRAAWSQKKNKCLSLSLCKQGNPTASKVHKTKVSKEAPFLNRKLRIAILEVCIFVCSKEESERIIFIVLLLCSAVTKCRSSRVVLWDGWELLVSTRT